MQSAISPLNPGYRTGAYAQQIERNGSGGSGSGSSESRSGSGHGGPSTAQGVVTGQIGSGYGPYSYQPVPPESSGGQRYQSHGGYSSARHSTYSDSNTVPTNTVSDKYNLGNAPATATLLWDQKADPEADDHLHNPSPHDTLIDGRSCTVFTSRGWLNLGALVILTGGLVGLFAGYPIVSYFATHSSNTLGAWNLGGINSTGQVGAITGFRGLVDKATPDSAMTRTGFDGQKYRLVFSDEFEQDGRTFWPGDDPFWEAVDLHYWATGNQEWYDPDAMTTKDGKLQITITEEPIHGLNFRSGMLQSWNKFCFTGGYVEARISLPGSYNIPGFWPGAWTMGNLARAGYGATTDGVWPFSYNSCDVGTMRNQTNTDGTTPAAAKTSGSQDYGGELSYQPGQRVSACTCPNAGNEHPGPAPNVGRGGPEIDIIEAQITYRQGIGRVGSVSQSAQFAPYDPGYNYGQTAPASTIYNAAQTYFNDYKGGIYQEAVSAVSFVTNQTVYGGVDYEKYGVEFWPDRSNGYITWSQGDAAMWTMTSATVGPNAATQVDQRLVSEEPMYLILNLGLSAAFQDIDWANLVFPSTMFIDYVRVYQREGYENTGCDPKDRPTSKYIQNHLNAYTNPNLTTWAQAGYTFPKNSRQDSC